MSEPRVLRASRQHYRRWLRGSLATGGALATGLFALNVARADSVVDLIVLVAIVALTPAAALAAVAVHIASSRVTLGDGWVEYTRWRWRRTVLRVDDGLVGLLAVYKPTLSNSPPTPLLMARRAGGGPRMKLSGAYWEQADLVAVAEALGLPVRERMLDAAGYERRAPGVMPWRERHWIAFGVVGALVVTAVVAAAVVGYFAMTDRPPFDDRPPRAVSAGTTRAQDAVVRQVVAVVGGRWEAPEVSLIACQDEDDYQGWRRVVTVEPGDVPRSMTDETVSEVVAAMADQGYTHVRGSKVDDVSGSLPGAAFGEDEVALELEPRFAGLRVEGHCEVPGR
ncbi:hypothetical protein [Aeromicrobium endophyticum]|uniref:Uncharacterized protein n=1 Tax=Aeromicrobium endophyticum TaxID=2292704 RepID=A0A371P0D4_9ACTN|nr:hypothetical protein [Aeromicrobium endophyticum]REK69060.1 hypothetical protein DX116_19650 [Aeromicrobium endophyticum]